MSDKLKVVLISSVLPAPTSGGELVLWRHLIDQPGLELEIHGVPPTDGFSEVLARVGSRLLRSRLRRWMMGLMCLYEGRWMDARLPKPSNSDGHTVVVTVAHGTLCHAALRYARKYRLPLITFFHDWWPVMPGVHEPIREFCERGFRRLYTESQATLCVCEGMKEALGPHKNAHVLFPIPSRQGAPEITLTAETRTFRVLYAGNLWDYGPMLGEALKAARGEAAVRIEVRGTNPRWDASLSEYAKSQGIWHDFAPRRQLEQWLSEADALLIPMVFEPTARRRMETSFPSKLQEYAQFGKPLVVWGPDYCSAAKWAKARNAALCVLDPSPQALIRELRRLADAPAERASLGAEARRVAENEFNPDIIQNAFREILNAVSTSGALSSGSHLGDVRQEESHT